MRTHACCRKTILSQAKRITFEYCARANPTAFLSSDICISDSRSILCERLLMYTQCTAHLLKAGRQPISTGKLSGACTLCFCEWDCLVSRSKKAIQMSICSVYALCGIWCVCRAQHPYCCAAHMNIGVWTIGSIIQQHPPDDPRMRCDMHACCNRNG